MALVAVSSDAGLRRSEASSLTWGDVQHWDDGYGRITTARSKTDMEAQGATVASTSAAMDALSTIRPARILPGSFRRVTIAPGWRDRRTPPVLFESGCSR